LDKPRLIFRVFKVANWYAESQRRILKENLLIAFFLPPAEQHKTYAKRKLHSDRASNVTKSGNN